MTPVPGQRFKYELQDMQKVGEEATTTSEDLFSVLCYAICERLEVLIKKVDEQTNLQSSWYPDPSELK